MVGLPLNSQVCGFADAVMLVNGQGLLQHEILWMAVSIHQLILQAVLIRFQAAYNGHSACCNSS